MMVKVSVVLPVYNGELYLAEAIESILNQTFVDYELLVINDHSTDRSVEIAKSYADKRIRIIDNPKKGLPAALNCGINNARGDYIARMDSDDISLPQRFEKQVALLDSKPHIGLCGCIAMKFNENGNIGPWETNLTKEYPGLADILYNSAVVCHPSVMFRKKLFITNNLYYNERVSVGEDNELWARAMRITRFYNIQEILLRYRVHGKNMYLTGMAEGNKTMADMRINSLKWLMPSCKVDVDSYSVQCQKIYDALIQKKNTKPVADVDSFPKWKYCLWMLFFDYDLRREYFKQHYSSHKHLYKFLTCIYDQHIKDHEYCIDYIPLQREWLNNGSSKKLMKIFKRNYKNNNYWNNQVTLYWVIYICCLIESNKKRELEYVLARYREKHGTWNFDKCLLTSKLMEVEPDHKKFDKTIFIEKMLSQNTISNILFELTKDKSVAIVGNAGSEIGKNKGSEIDSHDIIIRFNNYPMSGYEKDYGTRTNIWVRNCERDIEERTKVTTYDLVIWGPDLYHVCIPQNNIDVLYELFMEYRKSATHIPSEVYAELKKFGKIKRPTTGMLIIWIFYKMYGHLKNISLYGFSFLEENPDGKHYYDNACKINQDHDIISEKMLINRLLKG